MTVSTTDSVVEYVSGGPAFPIPYRFLQDSDIEAVLVKQDGTSETLTGAQYTLTGAGTQAGGTLTSTYAAGFLATPGASLTISRVMEAVQPTDLRNQGKFLAETHEKVFDRLTMLIQQGFAILRRALLKPIGKDYYDAQGSRISNLGNPTQNQDAVPKLYNEQYIAGLLSQFTGPINNASNVMLVYPDGVARSVQTLATKNDPLLGSAGIGHKNTTVGATLKALPDTFVGYASLQAALDAQTVGGTLYLPPGNYNVTTQLTMSIPGVTLWIDDAATINHNVPTTFTALRITAPGCTVKGGMNGGFVGPAAWDGANATPTYSVIRVEADRCTIQTKLVNIRKVGIWFKDCSYGVADGCFIQGNYPSASWTGVETVHYGILLDPGTGPNGGGFRVINNFITSCVQGILAGNYGVGGVARGVNISGNNFEDCWNHGIYSNYTDGAVIVANSFNRCQIPVVASGRHNVVSSNSIHTAVNAAGDQRDIVGISVRDASYSIISDNSIKGVVAGTETVVINLQYFAGVVGEMNGNVVSNNAIEITAGSCNPIRIEGTSGFGTTNASNNIISGNTIRASVNSDGAILLDGIATGANHGNQVIDNNIALTGGVDGIRVNNQLMGAVHGNTIEWLQDFVSATACNGVLVFGASQFCSVVNNSYAINFSWGQNANVAGLTEIAPASSNICHNNHNKVNTAKTATFVKVVPAANSLMDVQETGEGAPTFSARSGSTWRRYPFGGAAASFYVKESSTGATGWVGK